MAGTLRVCRAVGPSSVSTQAGGRCGGRAGRQHQPEWASALAMAEGRVNVPVCFLGLLRQITLRSLKQK